MRWNLQIGISDMVFVMICDVLLGVFSSCLVILPTMSLFAKITPDNIEGTIFALLTGTTNFSTYVLSPLIGSFINSKFIHPPVTALNLESYYKLCLVVLVTGPFGFILLRLIPNKSDISFWQKKRG
jgi:MFS family permease